jgi:class 3 adenylate cyclase
VRALLLRLYAAFEEQDRDTLRELLSNGAHLVTIGTDPEEWWTGPASAEILFQQAAEAKHILKPGTPIAYSMGSVGWVADQAHAVLPDGREVPVRMTMVAAIERGHWRVVQIHVSVGYFNQEALGVLLTTSIDAVERSVRDDRPDVSPASAPEGTVTIAFTDLESSTVLLDRLGDTEFLRLLAWHDRIVRDTAEQHRGFIVKSQGDGFMLAFPSAAFALRAVVTMRDRVGEGYKGLPVRMRAGLHSGEAIKHDDDFYGRTVVIAARIGALALGGEILASDLVYALARGLGSFKFGEARHIALKGLEGEFALYPVIG